MCLFFCFVEANYCMWWQNAFIFGSLLSNIQWEILANHLVHRSTSTDNNLQCPCKASKCAIWEVSLLVTVRPGEVGTSEYRTGTGVQTGTYTKPFQCSFCRLRGLAIGVSLGLVCFSDAHSTMLKPWRQNYNKLTYDQTFLLLVLHCLNLLYHINKY